MGFPPRDFSSIREAEEASVQVEGTGILDEVLGPHCVSVDKADAETFARNGIRLRLSCWLFNSAHTTLWLRYRPRLRLPRRVYRPHARSYVAGPAFQASAAPVNQALLYSIATASETMPPQPSSNIVPWDILIPLGGFLLPVLAPVELSLAEEVD